MNSVAYYTLGCKLNFAETSSIAQQLSDLGFVKKDFHSGADLYVINTCSVTDNADRKCRAVVRKALDISPGAFIVLIGCYAQLKPKEIATLPGVDLVLGANEKFHIADYLGNLKKSTKTATYACSIEDVHTFNSAFSVDERTRGFLKIQDGCDYSCTFCTIPMARGGSRSDSIENVLENAKTLAEKGVKEIVLTGVNTGDFGLDESGRRKSSFFDLLCQLEKMNANDRIRISSIEPNLLSQEIIELVAGSKVIMPHFHLPLQSGSDNILKAMRRRYNRSLYQSKVEEIRHIIPHAAIGVDVIVGFPDETISDFNDTYHFIKDLDISYLHVFSYSPRENTLAAKMDSQVDSKEKNERSRQLRILSEKKRRRFYQSHLHTNRPVLFETKNENNSISGFTDNYIKINSPYQSGLENTIRLCTLQTIDASGEVKINIPKAENALTIQ